MRLQELERIGNLMHEKLLNNSDESYCDGISDAGRLMQEHTGQEQYNETNMTEEEAAVIVEIFDKLEGEERARTDTSYRDGLKAAYVIVSGVCVAALQAQRDQNEKQSQRENNTEKEI